MEIIKKNRMKTTLMHLEELQAEREVVTGNTDENELSKILQCFTPRLQNSSNMFKNPTLKTFSSQKNSINV